jgi:hypothetical protein
MSSTYSNSLRIELIGSGDQAGALGTTTNSNFSNILDNAIAGYQTVSVTTANQALTYLNGATSTAALNQAVYAMLRLTTTTSAAFSIYAPPVPKSYIIWNNSGYTATIYNSTVIGNTTAAGTGIAIANGDKIIVWSDGTNFYDLQAQNLTGTLAINKGGTGQTTANAAFNALAPAQTANRVLRSDGTNTSFAQVGLTTDVTGTLPIANGGTGTTSTTFANLTTNVTGTLPVANGGTGATTFTSGAILKGAGTGAVTTASAADIVGQIGATAVTNAANATDATNATNAGTVTTVTSSQIGGANAGLSAGAVGTLAFLGSYVGGIAFGGNVAGSSLFPAGMWKGSTAGTNNTPSSNNGNGWMNAGYSVGGTWKCMGYALGSSWDQTIWMRIS